jgi:hypothetical protein
MLNGVSVARLTLRKPPAVMTSRKFRLAGLCTERGADLLG